MLCIDAVIPAYNENLDRLQSTIKSCLFQTLPFRTVIVVDDGSRSPIELPYEMVEEGRVLLIRFAENGGISRARNKGLHHSDADYIVAINVEIELDSDWLEKLVSHFRVDSQLGACTSRLQVRDPNSLRGRWRMRFQEAPYQRTTGTHKIRFATGHAVLFRRDALSSIGGYDERIASTGEDFDVCCKLRHEGWQTAVVDGTSMRSTQDDHINLLAKKELRHSGWWSREGNFIDTRQIEKWPAIRTAFRDFFHRVSRNALKMRWRFIVIDALVLIESIKVVDRENR